MEPVSLRKRQRERTRDEITDVALKLFTDDGYVETTMKKISVASGVGIATVFRYFKSKPRVLVAVIYRDLNEVLTDSQKTVDNPVESIEKGVTELILKCFSFLDKPSKNILSTQLMLIHTSPKNKEVKDLIDWAIAEVKKQIYEILRYYRKKGSLSKKYSLEDLQEIIYSVFNEHYTKCVVFNESYVELRKKLKRRIPILFAEWI